MNKSANQLLDSLLSYQFTPVIDKQWSHVALFKEYARRMAWWADAIGVFDNWLITNITYVLELDEGLDESKLQQLDTYLQTQALYQPMPTLLQSALMFEMVSEHDTITQFNLANPYSALVKLYTRSGYIRWNPKEFWEVSGSFGIGGVDIHSYKISTPFVSLDDEELDLIDHGDKQTDMPNL